MAAKVPVASHSPSDVSVGSIASVGLSWHVGFTPNSGRVAARQRTDASGQSQTLRGGVEQSRRPRSEPSSNAFNLEVTRQNNPKYR